MVMQVVSVSYTHLDVYKRQAVYGLELAPPGVVLLLEQLVGRQRRHNIFLSAHGKQPCILPQGAYALAADTESGYYSGEAL